jgi:hypothetical protein
MQKRNENNFPKRVSFRVSALNMNAKFDVFNNAKAEQQQPNASPQNTSGRVFEHVDRVCLLNNTSLDTAHSIWLKSMCISTEALDVYSECTQNVSTQRPLEVILVLHCNNKTSVQPTAYSLTMKISECCSKTFEFKAGADVHIPISTWRPTLVSVKLQQESDVVALQNVLVSNNHQTKTKIGENFWVNDDTYIVYSRLSTETKTNNLQFSCYMYQRDLDTKQGDYDMQSLLTDFTQLDSRPVVLPNKKISLVSSTEAQRQLAKLERHRQHLVEALDDCRRSTAIAELGATKANVADMMKNIDWKRSYCTPSDIHLSQVIVLARDMHNMLASTSNMAVYGTWFFQPQLLTDTLAQNVREAVCDLLSTRTKITERIAGRRSDLQSVVRVRTSFILLSAIDDALRSVCGSIQTSKNNLFLADNISCHAYWLGQIKSNTNNSVSMDDECFNEARSVLELCKRVKNSCNVLMPQCNIQLSNLGRSVWQNMHLQGLASADALVVASAPHFLYKHKQIVDYSKHPLVLALRKHQIPTEKQLESTKLLAILLCADVEHRIITCATQQMIEQKWELACKKSEGALHSLCSFFDPSLRSLITCACAESTCADISFLTDANNRPAITGYDNAVLSQYNSENLMRQISSLAL